MSSVHSAKSTTNQIQQALKAKLASMDAEIVQRVKQANKTYTNLQPLRHDRHDADSRIANTFRTNNTQLFIRSPDY